MKCIVECCLNHNSGGNGYYIITKNEHTIEMTAWICSPCLSALQSLTPDKNVHARDYIRESIDPGSYVNESRD